MLSMCRDHISIDHQIFHCIGGLVVKLAVAIRDIISMIRPAPGSIPGRCMIALMRDKSFILST
jgi:hypothetical protein